MDGRKSATSERTLFIVEKVAQARTTSFDVMGQNPFSRMVRLVCVLMELKRLQRMEKMRKIVAESIFFPSSKIVSSPPVVGVSVLLRRRSRI